MNKTDKQIQTLKGDIIFTDKDGRPILIIKTVEHFPAEGRPLDDLVSDLILYEMREHPSDL